jgi:GMP synthase-like glutamine amidotransferase
MQSLGILACGQVREDLVATHGEYPEMFARLLASVAPTLKTTAYRIYADEYPATPQTHDAYLITGSRFSVYDEDPWIRRLEEYVRALFAARKPTVGICFGHQMMARALGGVTAKAPQGWGIGKHFTQVLGTPTWMNPVASTYGVFVSHQDQVLQLPPRAERLATSAFCTNSMFVIDNLFLGIQGHPEFTGEFARELAAGRAEIYGEKTLAEAQKTYGEPADSLLVARWMVQFLSLPR